MKSTTAVIVPAIVFDSGGLLELMEAEGVTSMLLVPAEVAGGLRRPDSSMARP